LYGVGKGVLRSHDAVHGRLRGIHKLCGETELRESSEFSKSGDMREMQKKETTHRYKCKYKHEIKQKHKGKCKCNHTHAFMSFVARPS
jgi:hypothetical protein